MKKLLEFLESTLGELAAWAFLVIASAILSNWAPAAVYVLFGLFILGLAFTIYGICWAFIINPIRAWQERRKNKQP